LTGRCFGVIFVSFARRWTGKILLASAALCGVVAASY
jgi:hypothetical protein